MSIQPLISVKDLSIGFRINGVLNKVVQSISFDIFKGEILGIVGESGSGKSVTALSLMQLLPKCEKNHSSGKIIYKGRDLNELKDSVIQSLRGREIAMIFQEPMSALNPSMSCGKQLEEVLLQHNIIDKKDCNTEILRLFRSVKIRMPDQAIKKYPHELSGGQLQRVMIAMAMACKPNILIADEPTTALDVTVQRDIIKLIKSLQKETKMAVVFISHDLSLVSELANRTLVMYRGKIVEKGATKALFKCPQHPYTKALIAAKPELNKRIRKLPTVEDILDDSNKSDIITKKEREEKHSKLYQNPPLLEVINLEKTFFKSVGLFGKKASFKAVDRVSFKLYEGETLGLVGESGCGKSTLGNAILQLDKASAGTILYKGMSLDKLSKKGLRELRKEIQIIFQDPLASLNPRIRVGEAIMEPMKVHKLYNNKQERKTKAIKLLKQVGLDRTVFERYPHEFSGGQRQRISIARGIAVNPRLILFDESVSALDISVQAQVLNLLNTLKKKFGFTYIFISHDLAVVKYMSDQLLVMNKGKIEEHGEADAVYANPKSKYTKQLIKSIPKGL